MTNLCNLQPPQYLYNNSQLKNLKLKNLAIYPSDFRTQPSDGATLYWDNLNFQPIGTTGERVWQFQGCGFTDLNQVQITYITSTPYNINFEGPISGVVTSSAGPLVLNAADVASVASSTGDYQTIIRIVIKTAEPLKNFGFSIFQKDHGEGRGGNGGARGK